MNDKRDQYGTWDNEENHHGGDIVNLTKNEYQILQEEQNKIGDIYKNSHHCLLVVLDEFKNPESEISKRVIGL